MMHLFKSGWSGYAALACAILLYLATSLISGRASQHPLYILALICLLVLGISSGVRGLFSGTWPGRACAGISLVYLVWMVFFLIGAVR